MQPAFHCHERRGEIDIVCIAIEAAAIRAVEQQIFPVPVEVVAAAWQGVTGLASPEVIGIGAGIRRSKIVRAARTGQRIRG